VTGTSFAVNPSKASIGPASETTVTALKNIRSFGP